MTGSLAIPGFSWLRTPPPSPRLHLSLKKIIVSFTQAKFLELTRAVRVRAVTLGHLLRVLLPQNTPYSQSYSIKPLFGLPKYPGFTKLLHIYGNVILMYTVPPIIPKLTFSPWNIYRQLSGLGASPLSI